MPGSLNWLKGKKVGIVGLGKTGQAAYFLLRDHVTELFIFDDKVQHLEGQSIIQLEDPIWIEADYILVSPGISKSHKIFSIISKEQILAELAFLYKTRPQNTYIGITGSNGKTTTTALLGEILQENYIICGNIGIPCFSQQTISTEDKNGFIVELSSFQLDLINQVPISIGILLNITPNHLDRYDTMQDYVNSKLSIFEGLKHLGTNQNTYGIICIDDPLTKEAYLTLKETYKLIPNSNKQILKNGVSLINGIIYDNIAKSETISPDHTDHLIKPKLFLGNTKIFGSHNLQNMTAAYTAARLAGTNQDLILSRIREFKGVPHRLEQITEYQNILFINDSKSTTLEATLHAVRTFRENKKEYQIYLLIGGIWKLSPEKLLSCQITSAIDNHCKEISFGVRKIFYFGKDRSKLFEIFENYNIGFTFSTNLEEAFLKATEEAKNSNKQTIILLSPMATSLDQYINFEERGNHFIELVKNYIFNFPKV